MTLNEIKAAIDAGRQVRWGNDGYEVIKDNLGQYLIVYRPNGYTIGLAWRDGVTLNGKEEDFYIKKPTVRSFDGDDKAAAQQHILSSQYINDRSDEE